MIYTGTIVHLIYGFPWQKVTLMCDGLAFSAAFCGALKQSSLNMLYSSIISCAHKLIQISSMDEIMDSVKCWKSDFVFHQFMWWFLTCVIHTAQIIDIGWTSVCPSHANIVKTAQPIVKLSSLPGSPMILVFWGPPNFFPIYVKYCWTVQVGLDKPY